LLLVLIVGSKSDKYGVLLLCFELVYDLTHNPIQMLGSGHLNPLLLTPVSNRFAAVY
jgi:hypothetical protein